MWWCWKIIIICLTLRAPVCRGGNLTEEERVLEMWKSLESSISQFVNGGIKALMPMAMSAVTEVKLSSECQTAVVKFLFGLMKLRTWAFELIDATAKPSSGILYGTLAMYGDYEQCINLRAMDDKNKKELFRGSYCSVDIFLKLPPKPRTISVFEPMDIFRNFTEKKDTVVRYIANFLQILYGFNFRYDLCIPSKCKKEDLQGLLDYLQSDIDIVKLNTSWCDVREDMEFDWAHVVCTWAIATVAILVAAATSIDCIQRQYGAIRRCFTGLGKKGRYLVAFSAYKSLSRLFAKPADERIACLNGMRFISIVMTMIITTLLNFEFDIFANLFSLLNLSRWKSAQFILHGILYIDTLFLLSGITVMYTNIPREGSKDDRFHVISYILRRIFRIIPTYLFVTACVIVLPNAASGPMWNRTAVKQAKLCRTHWWENILFFNNFVTKPTEMCLDASWYIATDFQLYLIALIIVGLIVVWRTPMWAAFVATILSVAGMIAVGIITYVYEYSPTVLISALDIPKINSYLDIVYQKPHDHIASFSVGLAIGYLFVKKQKLKIPSYVRLFGWAASTCLWSSILFGISPWNEGYFPTEVLGSVFAATHRFAWSFALSWIIVASYYGYGGPVGWLLSHWAFAPLSRLSFSAFLGYTVCFNVVFGFYRTHVDVNRIDFVMFAIAFLVLIYVQAVVFYVAIDGPTIFLKDLIFYHPVSSSKRHKMEHVNGTCTKQAVSTNKRIPQISIIPPPLVDDLTKKEIYRTKEHDGCRL